MREIIGILALSLAVPVSAQAQDMPGWMAGCWEMRGEGDRWAEECWTIARGGQMMGSGRAGTGSEVASFEFMLIAKDEGGAITFAAAPGGNGWTVFNAAPDSGQAVTFVNPANDFPQKVRYWREGELLKARISLSDGSEAIEWSFARMGG